MDNLCKALGLPDDLNELYIWAKERNIYINISRLGPELWGYVFKSEYDTYLLTVDKNLSLELQQEVLIHELIHIIVHSPSSHPIRKNQYNIEREADELANRVIKEHG